VQRAEGHDAHLRIRILQQGLHGLLARLAQAGQQPNGPGPDEGVLIFEQTHQWFHGLVAVLEYSLLSRAANVDRRALQGSERPVERVELGLRHIGAEPLRSDAVNRSRGGLIPVGMTADTGVEPIGHVYGSVWPNGHIAGAEHHLEGLLTAAAALEVGTGIIPLGIAGQEVEALELEIGSVRLRQVAEDHIAAGFAAQQQSPVFLAQGTLLVKSDARGRSAPVDIPRRHRTRIFLTPLGHRRALARTPISTPGALAVQRAEAGIAVLH